MHLIDKQDHVLAGETTTWLERMDTHIGISTDRTIRFTKMAY